MSDSRNTEERVSIGRRKALVAGGALLGTGAILAVIASAPAGLAGGGGGGRDPIVFDPLDVPADGVTRPAKRKAAKKKPARKKATRKKATRKKAAAKKRAGAWTATSTPDR